MLDIIHIASKDADIIQRIGAAIRQRNLEVVLSQEKLAQKNEVDRSFIINTGRGDANLSVIANVIEKVPYRINL